MVLPVTIAAPAPLRLAHFDTPLGPMLAGATAAGLCLLEFTDRPGLAAEVQNLAGQLGAQAQEGESCYFEPLRAELAAYFGGERVVFSAPLVLPGTAFQQAVWQALLTIPHGATRSYGQQAAALHQPDAVRAVAAANGQNRVAIVVPCHRVISANGKLTGYAGGLWRKERLLRLEQKPLPLFA